MNKEHRVRINNPDSRYHGWYGYGVKAEDGGWHVSIDGEDSTMWFSDIEVEVKD